MTIIKPSPPELVLRFGLTEGGLAIVNDGDMARTK